MFISKKLIKDYQDIYKRKSGKDISNKEAERELCDLAKLIRLIRMERKKHHEK